MLHEGTDLSSVSGSMNILNNALKTPKTPEELVQRVGTYVDVRDLAAIHLGVLDHEAAGNERYIIHASECPFSYTLDIHFGENL